MPRRFPLPLRHMHSFGGCVAFARAISEHPCCAGGEVMDLTTSDVRRRTSRYLYDGEVRERVSPADAWIHTFVRRADGTCVDVNGAADFDDLCGAYGLDPQDCRAVPSWRHLRHPQAEDDQDDQDVRELADRLGWDGSVPRSPGTPDFDASLAEAFRLALKHGTGTRCGSFAGAYLAEIREREPAPAAPAP